MEEILEQLVKLNESLITITAYQSLILDEIKEAKGSGLYNSISDVCDKLDTLDSTISGMDITLMNVESKLG